MHNRSSKRSTPGNTENDHPQQSTVPTNGITMIVLVYLLLSLAIHIYERALIPLYASQPTRHLLSQVVFAATACAAMSSKRLSANRAYLLAPVLLAVAPLTTYLVAMRTARWRDPLWGPVVTHVGVVFPIVFAFADFAVALDPESSPAQRTPFAVIRRLGIRVGVGCIFTAQFKRLWPRIRLLNSISDGSIFLVLAITLVVIWANKSPRKSRTLSKSTHLLIFISILVAIHASIYALSHSQLVSLPRGEAYSHPFHPLRILSVEQSVTGLIIVGEGQLVQPSETDKGASHTIRYLRASHSILGGVWVSHAEDGEGPVLGDSIYSAFVLQEAARLVNSTREDQGHSWNNALIIGLGTGISASSFMKHNLATTIVEIDPAVYTAARRFFAMPDPGPSRVFLQDARGWVEQQRNNDQLFDIVVHDCFSGGGVPQHIFTVEFWDALKSLMHADGVIAVNYAGNIDSKPSRAVLATLEKSFGTCRAFHDSLEDIHEDEYDHQFVNLVFFCTTAERPLTFRQSLPADYLGSTLREHIFSTLPSREINLSRLRQRQGQETQLILTDTFNPLGRWQEDQAFEHWKLMRRVLPDVFWETY